MKTYTTISAIPELLIVLIGVAFIVWLIWRAWTDARKAALDQAWHEVLDEVYSTERRHFEERKRVEDYEHKRAAAARWALSQNNFQEVDLGQNANLGELHRSHG